MAVFAQPITGVQYQCTHTMQDWCIVCVGDNWSGQKSWPVVVKWWFLGMGGSVRIKGVEINDRVPF